MPASRASAPADGALVNIVDNLDDSQFITPAIVDRDPVTIAIGTEGAAPVLARAIKADLEERLPRAGPLARIGKAFRARGRGAAHGPRAPRLLVGYYFNAGPRAAAEGEEAASSRRWTTLLDRHLAQARAARGASTLSARARAIPSC